MRKYIKRQILQIVEVMKEANHEIEKLLTQNKEVQVAEILMDQQNAAIQIGTEIEKTESDAHGIVKDLENYCELLWKLSQAGEIKERLKICSQLANDIKEIGLYIKDQIQEQYVVVFLPYKASMWDSLESVWMAAKEDKDCTSFVIPIPYFDKNPNGSLSDMHYEGHLYPDNVPITDYNSFNLQSMHPEIIYFHNPYDQYNHITTVHPAFYSQELKKYTEMLVYIPYFVSGDEVPEHLCAAPGIFSADRVIVESQEIRKTYIKVYMDMLCSGSKAEDKQYYHSMRKKAEGKFLALGSPKFDKVLNTNRNNIQIPKEWEEKIHGKKVILYNTSVQALMTHKEKAVIKIENVLQNFKKMDHVVLLWRPHPLNEATLSSMIPDVAESYSRLIAEYKEEGWGIYDDTPDLHRAIALSDAYYGDGGSLIPIYEFTEKPIMIQNTEVVY